MREPRGVATVGLVSGLVYSSRSDSWMTWLWHDPSLLGTGWAFVCSLIASGCE